ncbi:hypothetical protein CIHG_10273 [Coccidioides immitis H538.4]|uniref:Uncharacterized protein n=3 Tax=Coccidioides immitis TaxID=5501 RepID=A0A0J8QTH1_COCIT|nr:hypothetical protein CIRG_10363 [Coccidioides immitis RMSCC 2394]KMU75751.1 hypothetical protein CISG_04925 [Coccidioides immitis RMSCC 3703]KMU92529.1 hypothetical protein CIHG_10273 [Coccidioides immitis H538.4]
MPLHGESWSRIARDRNTKYYRGSRIRQQANTNQLRKCREFHSNRAHGPARFAPLRKGVSPTITDAQPGRRSAEQRICAAPACAEISKKGGLWKALNPIEKSNNLVDNLDSQCIKMFTTEYIRRSRTIFRTNSFGSLIKKFDKRSTKLWLTSGYGPGAQSNAWKPYIGSSNAQLQPLSTC